MDEQELKFTVFTSTFNASRTLHRVYESLRGQSLRSFEWLVVDDGSTDGTPEIISKLQADSPFPIRLERQEHSGTAASFNRAISLAQGVLFFQIDHDDGCLPTALENLWGAWKAIPEHTRAEYAGLYVRSCDENGKPNGPGFCVPWRDATFHEQYYKFRVREDQRPCWNTSVIREFPAPVLKGFSGWFPEGYTHARVGRVYKAHWMNEILYTYYQNDPDRTSLARNGHAFPHWPGLRVQHRDRLAFDAYWFRYAPIQFYRQAIAYANFSFRQGLNPAAQWGELETGFGRALWMTALPLGFALNVIDKARSWRSAQRAETRLLT